MTTEKSVDERKGKASLSHRNTSPSETKSGNKLLLDADSEQDPILSVVMPTLNEQEGVAECIERIKNALEELQVYGEIVVSDSSTDRTPEIAQEMGARVVHPDAEGYGYAYLYGFQHVRGQIFAMGDADTTYDFEELPKLFSLVSSGKADIAMGSRLRGEIKKGAMPPLHQHVGNPLLTTLLNVFYDTDISDAHSGMRVFTRDAYKQMDLNSPGMEFASEMVMEAGARDLRIQEVPITYHPREGEATLDSFHDGWRHVRFMLINAPGRLFSGPGLLITSVGLLIMTMSLLDVALGGTTLGVHSMVAGSLFTLAGAHVVSFGVFSTLVGDTIREPNNSIARLWQTRLGLEHGATAGLIVLVAGVAYLCYLVTEWTSQGYAAVSSAKASIAALAAVVLGIQVIFTSFFLSVIAD